MKASSQIRAGTFLQVRHQRTPEGRHLLEVYLVYKRKTSLRGGELKKQQSETGHHGGFSAESCSLTTQQLHAGSALGGNPEQVRAGCWETGQAQEGEDRVACTRIDTVRMCKNFQERESPCFLSISKTLKIIVFAHHIRLVFIQCTHTHVHPYAHSHKCMCITHRYIAPCHLKLQDQIREHNFDLNISA